MSISNNFKEILYSNPSNNERQFDHILKEKSIYENNNYTDEYNRTEMHYFVSAKHHTYNFWKIYTIMSINNRSQFSSRDTVYGRYVIHYAAANAENEWDRRHLHNFLNSTIVMLIEIAHKTYSGYYVKDTVYNKTARKYIRSIYNGTLVKIVDNMYHKKARKIQLYYRKYKFSKVFTELKFLPPSKSKHFCGGIFYIEAKTSFDKALKILQSIGD
jgi:hypothetical protein